MEEQRGEISPAVIAGLGRQTAMHIVAIVTGDGHLMKVVLALGTVGGLAHFLHRRQQQTDQNGDDGDHYQQLDQRETAAFAWVGNTSATHGETPKRQRKQDYGKRPVELQLLQTNPSGNASPSRLTGDCGEHFTSNEGACQVKK